MLNSIGVVLVIIGLFYMIAWLLKNDGAKHINDQTGLFAMRRIPFDSDVNADSGAATARSSSSGRPVRARTTGPQRHSRAGRTIR